MGNAASAELGALTAVHRHMSDVETRLATLHARGFEDWKRQIASVPRSEFHLFVYGAPLVCRRGAMVVSVWGLVRAWSPAA